ncbi:hypothetical protein KUL49_18470 [Alteromonas sp. KUL49]|nr:hypothetical protein KUL49_18470 [Alteromonas sp. KUL49]
MQQNKLWNMIAIEIPNENISGVYDSEIKATPAVEKIIISIERKSDTKKSL